MQPSSLNLTKKPSIKSSENTRDISSIVLSKEDISEQEYCQLDSAIPLKDLDDGRKIHYVQAVGKCHTGFLSNSSASESFFKKQKKECEQQVEILFRDMKRGNISNLKSILKHFPIPISIRRKILPNNTLLHEAIKYQQGDICLFLIKLEPTLLNTQNQQGRTPCHFALIYFKELFLAIMEDYIDLIDWSVQDKNKVHFHQFANFYQYESSICQKIRSLVQSPKYQAPMQERSSSFSLQKSISIIPSFEQFNTSKEFPLSRSHTSSRKIRVRDEDNNRDNFSTQTSLADFTVLRQLGQGSFAKVYKVRYQPSGNIYALKVFLKNMITHQTMKYILSQKNILMKLSHPFLVNIHCSFETPTLYCYLMDCCEGTLRDVLNKHKELPENWIKLITCQLISVIGYLHLNQIIYRDLKPENVGYDIDGHIRLIDFGLAKEGNVGHSFCGSYHYLPPEMVTSKPHSFTVDWYMLGVVVYQLSNGKTPFRDHNKDSLFKKIVRQKHQALLGVSPEMANFVDQILIKNSSSRLGANEDQYQLMDHPWFDDIQWNSIPKRRYRAFCPLILPFKDCLNEKADVYFLRVTPKRNSSYNFIQVPRWAQVKQKP